LWKTAFVCSVLTLSLSFLLLLCSSSVCLFVRLQAAHESDAHEEEEEQEDEEEDAAASGSEEEGEGADEEEAAEREKQEAAAAAEREEAAAAELKDAENESKYDSTTVGIVSTTPPEVSFKISTEEPLCASAILVLLAHSLFRSLTFAPYCCPLLGIVKSIFAGADVQASDGPHRIGRIVTQHRSGSAHFAACSTRPPIRL
jgi:hypothetical protein